MRVVATRPSADSLAMRCSTTYATFAPCGNGFGAGGWAGGCAGAAGAGAAGAGLAGACGAPAGAWAYDGDAASATLNATTTIRAFITNPFKSPKCLILPQDGGTVRLKAGPSTVGWGIRL